MMIRVAGLGVIMLALVVGCSPDETSKDKPGDVATPSANDQIAANIKMLTDQSRDTSDFLQQIRTSLKLVNGVLVIEDIFGFELFVVPPNSPWVLQCGAGLKVVFGNSNVDGEDKGVHNDPVIKLSLALISRERCRELAPLIGQEIQSIVNSR
jgi:hypothetical protein